MEESLYSLTIGAHGVGTLIQGKNRILGYKNNIMNRKSLIRSHLVEENIEICVLYFCVASNDSNFHWPTKLETSNYESRQKYMKNIMKKPSQKKQKKPKKLTIDIEENWGVA